MTGQVGDDFARPGDDFATFSNHLQTNPKAKQRVNQKTIYPYLLNQPTLITNIRTAFIYSTQNYLTTLNEGIVKLEKLFNTFVELITEEALRADAEAETI